MNSSNSISTLIPSKVRRNIKKTLYFTILKKKPVHFIHIPKTGGTAIQVALHKNAITKNFFLEFHNHNKKLSDIPVGEKVIFFVRDPVTRFSSGFYTRWRRGKPRNYSPWTPGEKKAFEKFNTLNSLALALSSDDADEKKMAVNAMKSIGHVNTSFWNWFESESYFLSRLDDIFFFGYQESLDKDFEQLKEKLEIPKRVKLPTTDVGTHRTPPGLDTSLDEKAIANLKTWYTADYEFLALCRQIVPQVKSSSGIV